MRKKGCTTLLWWDSKIKRTCWLQPRWLTHYNSFITFWIIHFKIVTRIANDQFSVLHHGAILHHPMLILILRTLDHVSTVKVTTKTQIFTDQKVPLTLQCILMCLMKFFSFCAGLFFFTIECPGLFRFFFKFCNLPTYSWKQGRLKMRLKKNSNLFFGKILPTSEMV